MQVWWLHHLSLKKVSKGAKIRNRYTHVPHLTQDTNWKVCRYIGQYKRRDVSKQLSECHSNITCVKLTNATTTKHVTESNTKKHTSCLIRGLLSCQPRVTVASCFVYKIIRDLESINHLCINHIHRIGLIHK